ncbi:putative minor capsid protein [Halalkalibacter krulwichiae]|uniref:Minor capsid protein n=1 Tax=Halalkalibacter krulwichiae TaxID=199441 RepID=A0A1X9M9E5_9BACI|nr:putative minor capsid protein [Halalkalibacter krulwichiae]ARK28793.1 Minor capsid protein [Halalkalibacter krulwichiae]
MPKPPIDFCIDSFEYKEYLGENSWSEPEYAAPVLIEHCRIDRGAEYTSTTSGKQLLYNAVVFCYEGITTPLPVFKVQSVLVFDGLDHVLTKVIPIYEAYSKTIYSYELEVV